MLGKNIQYLRKQNHMTQEELASKLNVSRQAISKWEGELTEPDIQTLMKLSEIFDVSIDDMVKGEDGKKEIDKNDTEKVILETNKNIKRLLLIVIMLIGAFVIPRIIDNMSSYFDNVIEDIDKTLEEIQNINTIFQIYNL